MTQITFSETRVFACDLHLAAETQVVAAKYFSACNKPSRKRFIVAISYSYGPRPFKDSAARQRDVQNPEVALTIVTQGMGLFRHNKPATVELIVDFTQYPAVRQRVPCFCVSRRGYFPQLIPAD
jgi:hypothetical protein